MRRKSTWSQNYWGISPGHDNAPKLLDHLNYPIEQQTNNGGRNQILIDYIKSRVWVVKQREGLQTLFFFADCFFCKPGYSWKDGEGGTTYVNISSYFEGMMFRMYLLICFVRFVQGFFVQSNGNWLFILAIITFQWNYVNART